VRRAAWAAAALGALLAAPARAQDGHGGTVAPAAEQHEAGRTRPLADTMLFLAGGALGLGIHESGHILMGLALDAHPGVKGISFGPIPFFAITHDPVPPGQEYAISAAGFWMQDLASEWVLTAHPGLREEHRPVSKGILAFHVLASAAYGAAALGHFGPAERDTRSMAQSLRVDESWVGVLVLAPAAMDTWRYFRPGAAWPRWISRAAKVGTVLLVIRAAS
jgi:hypothetical protein